MEKRVLRVAVVQMRSTQDPWENLGLVDAFVVDATEQGAQVVFFPENALFRGPVKNRGESLLHPASPQALDEALIEFSAGWGVEVFLGSVLEEKPGSDKPFNSTLRLGLGANNFIYRKIHLFDFQGSEGNYKESDRVSAGEHVAFSQIGPAKIGHSICYDLRFPELYRKLLVGGANVLSVPSAFTEETGRAHWHTLLKARAIENLSFVVAPAQWGAHEQGDGSQRSCYGHALVISPWGEILAEGPGQGDALLLADLDFEDLEKRRQQLPSIHGIRSI